MVIGVDPNLGTIGGLTIAWHGLVTALGIIVAMWTALWQAKRHGLQPQDVVGVFPWAIILGLAGARISHVIDNIPFYSRYPHLILAMWNGGMGWYGGLIGATVAVALYARAKRLSMGRLLDLAAIGGFLGLAVGRIGCFLNGDSWGLATSLPWGVTYINPHTMAPLGIKGHPAALYEIIWIVLMVGALWVLRKRFVSDGSMFLTSVAIYSVGRFLISWTRGEPAILGPLHQAHVFSILLFAGAIGLLVYRRMKRPSLNPRVAAPPPLA